MTILGRSEGLVSRCVECDLAEPESLASLGGSAPGVVDGILSRLDLHQATHNGFCWLEDGACGGGASGSGRARTCGGHVVFLNNQLGQSYLLGAVACWCGD